MKKIVVRRRRSSKNKIVESRLRSIIVEELIRKNLIEEGLWDEVSGGVKKLAAYVTRQFKSVAPKWAATISEKVAKLSKLPAEVTQIIGVLKNAMAETGEQFKLDAALQSAKKLGQLSPQAAISAAEADLEGPVRSRAEKATMKAEGKYIPSIYAIVSDTAYTSARHDSVLLRESLTLATGLGVVMAIMGGLPMLFKGLHKLATVLGAEKTAEMMKHAEHVTHAFEQNR
jgi:hypothetical protein